jgi:hypothetical protein
MLAGICDPNSLILLYIGIHVYWNGAKLNSCADTDTVGISVRGIEIAGLALPPFPVSIRATTSN